MQTRAFGGRALGGEGALHTSLQVWEALCLPSDPPGTEHGQSVWERLGETSHRTVINNTERVTADFVQTSRDGNTYKQTFHSLETGMELHCICLDCSGQGCAPKPTHLGRSHLQQRVLVWLCPPANEPKKQSYLVVGQCCPCAPGLQCGWLSTVQATSLLRANSEQSYLTTVVCSQPQAFFYYSWILLYHMAEKKQFLNELVNT